MEKYLEERKMQNWQRVLFVLLSAFMTGFAWRARGDHGWGSFKGMAMVAFTVVILVITFFPYKKKLNSELFPLVILMTALTNAGYGTFNSQMTGVLGSNSPSGIADQTVNISPLSGVAIMLLLGFGWAPFLCTFIGYYFSDKKRRWWQLLITIAVFYAVDYACRATVSHLIIKLINPQAVSAYARALPEAGFDMTPYKAYMSHFSNISFGKKAAFGRNYYQSIECISSAIGTLAVFIYTRFFVRDKKGARIQLVSCCALGVAITVADLCLFVAHGGYRGSITPPAWLTGWSCWEYFTGFLFGLFVAVIVLAASKGISVSAENLQPSRLMPDKKPLRFIWNFGAFMCFVTAVALLIPAALRLTDEPDLIFSKISFAHEEDLIPFLAPAGVLALIYPALSFTKKERENPLALFDCAKIILPAFWGIVLVSYMCFGGAPLLHGSCNDYDILTYISAAVVTVTMTVMLTLEKGKKNA